MMNISHSQQTRSPTMVTPPQKQHKWARFASSFLERMQCCNMNVDDLPIADEADDSIFDVTADDSTLLLFEDPHERTVQLDPSSRQPDVMQRPEVKSRHSTSTRPPTLPGRGQPRDRNGPFLSTMVERACCNPNAVDGYQVGINTSHHHRHPNSLLSKVQQQQQQQQNGVYARQDSGGTSHSSVFSRGAYANKPAADSTPSTSQSTLPSDQDEIRSSATTQVVSHRTLDFHHFPSVHGRNYKQPPPSPVLVSHEEDRQDQDEEQSSHFLMRVERPTKKLQR